MNLRLLHCPACKTAYMIEDEAADRPPPCPKCGASPGKTAAARPLGDEGPTVFVPSTPPRRRGMKVAALVVSALVVLAAVVAVAWPTIRRRWHRPPADPIEAAATAYLRALVAGDTAAASKLGTVELPPAIRSFRDLKRDRPGVNTLRGSFAPISALHARIEESYTYDPALGRYTPRNSLVPAAEVLDALRDAKANAEVDEIAKKIQSGSPDDLFDAAEGLGKTFTNLAEGALSPKKLLPTYAMLLDDANPPLPPEEKALAKDVADHRAEWDALLGRPFATLKADGPFVLERAELTASVVDALGSAGDPPTPLRLTLTRFRLEGIDTGWRVTSAHRGGVASPQRDSFPSTAAKNSGDGR